MTAAEKFNSYDKAMTLTVKYTILTVEKFNILNNLRNLALSYISSDPAAADAEQSEGAALKEWHAKHDSKWKLPPLEKKKGEAKERFVERKNAEPNIKKVLQDGFINYAKTTLGGNNGEMPIEMQRIQGELNTQVGKCTEKIKGDMKDMGWTDDINEESAKDIWDFATNVVTAGGYVNSLYEHKEGKAVWTTAFHYGAVLNMIREKMAKEMYNLTKSEEEKDWDHADKSKIADKLQADLARDMYTGRARNPEYVDPNTRTGAKNNWSRWQTCTKTNTGTMRVKWDANEKYFEERFGDMVEMDVVQCKNVAGMATLWEEIKKLEIENTFN